jgi:hypothetical protein
MRGTFGRRSVRLTAVVIVLAVAVVSAATASGVRSKLPKGVGKLAGVPAKTSLH